MGVSDARRRAARSERAGRPVFDLVVSKLRRPLLRPGTIRRSLLIERLRQDAGRPIVSVVAPPGYGKTTLLSQWAEANGQAFAWVSVEERDNDPKVLRVGARLGPGHVGLAGWSACDYRAAARSETRAAMARAVSWKCSRRPR